MRKFLMLSSILLLACGGDEGTAAVTVDSSQLSVDTLIVWDSIGVLMGDSCYMIGSIVAAEALPGGGVILFDRSTGLLSTYDGDGQFISSFGGLGEAPGRFNLPGQMTVLGNGVIVVFDWMDREVCFFTPEGEYIGCRSNLGFEMPLSMTAAGDSCFLVYSCPSRRIDNTFKMGYELNLWEGTLEDPRASIFSHLFDFGQEGYDFRPGYLAVGASEDGRIFLHRMNSEDYLIEVFDLDGVPVDSIVSDAVLIPTEEIERYVYSPIASFMVRDEDGNGDMVSGEATDYSPQVENLGVDSLGNLWAQRGSTEEIMWDVFSPEGQLERHVILDAFPDSAFIHVEINEHGIVAWDRAPEDYPRLYFLRFSQE